MKVGAAVLPEKLLGIVIPPDPHGVDLTLRPFVEVDAAHERDVHAHLTVCRAAVQAEEDAVGRGGPRRAGVGTVEADAVGWDIFQFAKLGIFIRGWYARLAFTGGCYGSVGSDISGHCCVE